MPSNAVFCSYLGTGVTIGWTDSDTAWVDSGERDGGILARPAAIPRNRPKTGWIRGRKSRPISTAMSPPSSAGRSGRGCRSIATFTISVVRCMPRVPSWMHGCEAAGKIWPRNRTRGSKSTSPRRSYRCLGSIASGRRTPCARFWIASGRGCVCSAFWLPLTSCPEAAQGIQRTPKSGLWRSCP